MLLRENWITKFKRWKLDSTCTAWQVIEEVRRQNNNNNNNNNSLIMISVLIEMDCMMHYYYLTIYKHIFK